MEDYNLRDGTALSVPSGAYFSMDQGYGLENHGVDPDEEVRLRVTKFIWAALN